MKISTRIRAFYSLFKKAVKGTETDFTSGSIDKAILLLSVPMVLEMAMESLFAIVDVFYVSRLGKNAVAAVGLTESTLSIIYSIAMGLSMAATAMIARRIGEKNEKAASEAAVQAIYIGLVFAALVGGLGAYFATDILQLMGASAEVIEEGHLYTRIMLGGNFSIVLLFLINGIFRGAGDASLAMRSLIISNSCNILLGPVFIFGLGPVPAYGVTGAAIATTIGRSIGVAYQLYHLFKGMGIIKIHLENIRVQLAIIGRLLNVAAGGAGQFLIASASWIFLIRIISMFGSDALAGYTIAIRVVIFAIMPAWGMANAAATLVGQNLGAGFPERAEKSVWRTAYFNMLFLGSVGLIFWIFARVVIRFFSADEQVVLYGTQCLHYVCLGYVFYAYGMVVSSSFNGAGDTRTPTILNLFGFWAIQIPVAYFMAVHLQMGPKGVFIAIALAESILATAAILMFRRGRWKLVKI
ncbi:MATE family efflux transporter [Solitalea sp. MAHUQ-68]|uniref:Multidrug-efflux transporter n=1 Tax=Solitalea agri TaxID=2953739 RepID=A0A9X2F0R6_9SPHI|nr:MATE family efflux transporter [Solitalea agri]MCO4292574.1 MATE family efflux transporter [Solitalea agri]